MAAMNRSKSVKVKEEDGKETVERKLISPAELLVVFVYILLIREFLIFVGRDAWGISETAQWVNDLLSEYDQPRIMYESLFRSREVFISEVAYTQRRDAGLLLLQVSQDEGNSSLARFWDSANKHGWKPCVDSQVVKSVSPIQNGFFQVFCTGGLFQLHICVCNAVATAKLLNATLVIPFFTHSAVWKDPSKFHDIYDIDHFMSYLKNDLPIVKNLPAELDWSTPEYYQQCADRPNCLIYIPKHANQDWYMNNVLPLLQRYGVAASINYHHKLTFDGLPSEIVKLRCRTSFHALKFISSIVELSETLVNRVRAKAKAQESISRSLSVEVNNISANSLLPQLGLLENGVSRRRLLASELSPITEVSGRFIGLHLRFEKDMIAHSACYFHGGRAERKALAAYRRYIFKNRVAKARFHPKYLRLNGSCPLTPEEAGLLLAGLGYNNRSVVYIAGKSVYGGEARLKPLRQLFPSVENKKSLATEEELRPFALYGLKLAALDFLVLLKSDVYMSSAAGNFPNVLTGYRTFCGVKKSIHPDKASLARLLSNASLSWNEFSEQVRSSHSTRLGDPVTRRPKFSVYRYPIPDCMCHD